MLNPRLSHAILDLFTFSDHLNLTMFQVFTGKRHTAITMIYDISNTHSITVLIKCTYLCALNQTHHL